MDKDEQQKTWQVYNFGKRNVFRLDLSESIYILLVRVTVPLHSSVTPHSYGVHQHRKKSAAVLHFYSAPVLYILTHSLMQGVGINSCIA